MADYDLGTAHGKIKVDYDGKGFQDADKSMSSLQDKAAKLGAAASALRRRWGADFSGMADDVTRLARTFTIASGGLAVLHGLFGRTGSSITTLRGAMGIVSGLGLALGAVPKGAEGFPKVILNIIRIAAAIRLFQSGVGILGTVVSRFSSFGVLTGLLRGFGAQITALAGRSKLLSAALGSGTKLFRDMGAGASFLNSGLQGIARGALFAAAAFTSFKFAKNFITSMAKPLLLTQAGLAALGGSIKLLAGLIDAAKQLSGVFGLLPGGILAAAIAFGTLKVGMMGFMDAVKTGKGLEKLAPEARAVAIELRSLKDRWTEVQQAVQNKLFEGIAQQIGPLAKTWLPMLKTGMVDVAGSLRQVAQGFLDFAKAPENVARVGQAFSLTGQIIRNLAPAIQPLLTAFLQIGNIGLKVLNDITKGAGNAAAQFNAWVTSAAGTAKIEGWIRGGVKALQDLWKIAQNVGLALDTIFKGLSGGSGAGFLATIVNATNALNAFLLSAQGQAVLATLKTLIDNAMTSFGRLADVFINSVLPAIQAFLPYWSTLSQAFMSGIVIALQILAPLFQALGNALSFMAPVIGPIVTAIVALGVTALGLVIAFKIVGTAIGLLKIGLMGLRGAWAVAGFGVRLLTGSLGPVEGAIVGFVGRAIAAIGRLAGALIVNAARMAAAWLVAIGPVGWIILAVIAVGVAFAVLWAKCEGFRNFMIGLWNGIKAAWNAAIAWIQTIPAMIGSAFSSLGTTISTAFQAVVTWFSTLPARIGAFFVQLGTTIATGARTAWNWLGTTLSTALTAVWTWLTQLPMKVAFALGYLAGLVYLGATAAWKWLTTTLPMAIAAVGIWLIGLPAKVGAWLLGLGIAVMTAATQAWNWLVTTLTTVAIAIGAWFASLPGLIGAWLAGVGAAIAAGATAAWNWLVSTCQTAIAAVGAFLSALPGQVGAWLASLPGILGNAASTAWNAFTAACSAGWGAAKAFIAAIPGQIMGFFSAAGTWLVEAGKAVLQGLWNGMKAIASQVLSWIASIGKQIAAGFKAAISVKSPSKIFDYFGRMTFTGYWEGLKALAPKILDYVKSFGQQIAEMGQTHMTPAGVSIGQSLRAGIESQLPALAKTLGGIDGMFGKTRNGIELFDIMFGLFGRRWGGMGKPPVTPPVTPPTPTTPANAISTYVPTNPYAGASGGDTAPVNNYTIESVTIDGQTIETMNNVADFFSKVTQTARAGKA
jgi:DNA-binding phage protein